MQKEEKKLTRRDQNETLNIGALVYPNVDQADLTLPFEVLSRISGVTFHVIGKHCIPVRDAHGLILTPEVSFSECLPLDVLVVPGGAGQEQLMSDEVTLSFIRNQAENAQWVFSVCTGALLCGAAGLLRGVKATTHWAAFHLLEYFGAIPVRTRVVIDRKHVSAAGVSAGLDGALTLVSLLRGRRAAQRIQLSIEYAPEPPFNAGSPSTAHPDIVSAVRDSYRQITEQRQRTAREVANRLATQSDVSARRDTRSGRIDKC